MKRLRLFGHGLAFALWALFGRHWYLSTGCLHGRHEHCRCDRALSGEPKEPNSCKFGNERCRCRCHKVRADSQAWLAAIEESLRAARGGR